MLTERLVFKIDGKGTPKDFLKADLKIWTPWVQKQGGYLGKTTRVLSGTEVEILVFWKSQEEFDVASAKKSEMNRVDKDFKREFPYPFRLVTSSASMGKSERISGLSDQKSRQKSRHNGGIANRP